MPHKTKNIKEQVNARRPLINPELEMPSLVIRRLQFLCIGEIAPNQKRCIELQIEAGAPQNLARACEGSCIAKLIRQKAKTRRTIER